MYLHSAVLINSPKTVRRILFKEGKIVACLQISYILFCKDLMRCAVKMIYSYVFLLAFRTIFRESVNEGRRSFTFTVVARLAVAVEI